MGSYLHFSLSSAGASSVYMLSAGMVIHTLLTDSPSDSPVSWTAVPSHDCRDLPSLLPLSLPTSPPATVADGSLSWCLATWDFRELLISLKMGLVFSLAVSLLFRAISETIRRGKIPFS